MIWAFDSPGSVSAVFIIHSPPEIRQQHEGQSRATHDGTVPHGSSALSGAPNWLAAESVSVSCCRLARWRQCTLNTTAQSRISADNKAVLIGHGGECQMRIPTMGMCARMWAQGERKARAGLLSSLHKRMKIQIARVSPSQVNHVVCRLRSSATEVITAPYFGAVHWRSALCAKEEERTE